MSAGAGRGLRHLYGKDVARPKQVRRKEDQLAVRREANVRLQPVVMVRHVHQLLAMKDSRPPERRIVETVLVLSPLRMKQVDPRSGIRTGHLTRVSAVASEQCRALIHVEVNRPLVALHVVRHALVGRDIEGCQDRSLRPWETASRTRRVSPSWPQNSWPAISINIVRL